MFMCGTDNSDCPLGPLVRGSTAAAENLGRAIVAGKYSERRLENTLKFEQSQE
jgi:hypothetical protein